jgi:hypothetical protein
MARCNSGFNHPCIPYQKDGKLPTEADPEPMQIKGETVSMRPS